MPYLSNQVKIMVHAIQYSEKAITGLCQEQGIVKVTLQPQTQLTAFFHQFTEIATLLSQSSCQSSF